MTSKQKKLIEQWLVLGVLLVILITFQDADWDVRWAFLPVLIYFVMNWKHIDEFQRRNPKPMEIIGRNKKIRYWVYGCSVILIVGAFIILLSGFNILNYAGFGSLLLLICLPLLPVVVASQCALYQELGK